MHSGVPRRDLPRDRGRDGPCTAGSDGGSGVGYRLAFLAASGHRRSRSAAGLAPTILLLALALIVTSATACWPVTGASETLRYSARACVTAARERKSRAPSLYTPLSSGGAGTRRVPPLSRLDHVDAPTPERLAACVRCPRTAYRARNRGRRSIPARVPPCDVSSVSPASGHRGTADGVDGSSVMEIPSDTPIQGQHSPDTNPNPIRVAASALVRQ